VSELIRGLLYLAALAGAVFLAGVHLDAPSAMTIRVGAEIAGMTATLILLASMLPREVRNAKPAYQFGLWRKGLISFAAGDAMHLILQQIDVVMLGIMRPMQEVGIYRMGANFATVIFFASIIAGVMVNPLIASSWAQGRRDALQDVCVRLSRVGFGLTLAVYICFIAASPIFIALLGPGFQQMGAPLAILGAGYLFRAGVSATPSILLMTGGERDVAWGIAGAAIFNTLLNLALIPMAGMIGASIATAVSMSLLGVFFAIRAYQRTGIDGTIFGLRGNAHA
jgi:O-antigen/teichoic acid export membrane protein